MIEKFSHEPESQAPTAARVLVVDGNAERRAKLEMALTQRGLWAVGCSSAGAALAKLQSHRIDAVALHSGERVENGIEACRHLTTNWPDLPVVVVAEGGRLGSAVEIFQAGAYDLLLGSIERRALLDSLEHAAQVGVFRREKQQPRAGRATPIPEAPSPREQVERRHLLGVLLAARGSKTRAARALGIDRSSLVDRLADVGVEASSERDDDSTVVPLPPPAPIRRAS